MSVYRDYTIEISLKSSLVTPLQSDTIFGHICWAIRFLKLPDHDGLSEFLALFKQDGLPPLLVSNGFQKGYLPKPIMRPVSREEIEQCIGGVTKAGNAVKIKTIKRAELVPINLLEEFQNSTLEPAKLFKTMWGRYGEIEKVVKKAELSLVQHNTVNRLSNMVKTGLYTTDEYFHCDDNREYDIYLKTNHFSEDELNMIFRFIGESGFGKDKSTGKGHFDFSIRSGTSLPEAKKPNGFMTLSSFVPRNTDPIRGSYNILHKYGKLGGSYAGGSNPFKKPLIMLSAGSTFFDPDYRLSKYYGSLLDGMHHEKPEIRHYAYAFPMGLRLEEVQ